MTAAASTQADPKAKRLPRLSLWVFALTGAVLGFLQYRLHDPVPLLAERFMPGAGWAEVLLLAGYGAFVAAKMQSPASARVWRPRIWRLFSIVFFGQFLLGLSGIDKMLMTGRLHIPVPALIAAGPLYRGGGFFMPVLFVSTVILVGPAWCSQLCYIGAWDDLAASGKRVPGALPRWREGLRAAIAVTVIAGALLMGMFGVPGDIAAMTAIAFGLGGVGVMLWLSRKTGAMVHCTSYCPMGLFAVLLGKLNPFRLRIAPGCTECGACISACRYDALNMRHIRNRKPGLTCTLCGDCIGNCRDRHIGYRLPGVSPGTARAVFLVLIVTLHAVFLGVARI